MLSPNHSKAAGGSSGSSDNASPGKPAPTAGPSRQYETAKRVRSAKTIWACDRCYRLKSKCDSGRPSCATCLKGRVTCSYTARERGMGAARRGRRTRTVDAYVMMLEERLLEVEGLMRNRRANGRPTGASRPALHAEHPSFHPYGQEHENRANVAKSRAEWLDPSLSPVFRPGMNEFSIIPSPTHPAAPAAITHLPPVFIPHPDCPDIFDTEMLQHLCRVYFDVCIMRWSNLPLHPKVFWAVPFDQHPPFLILSIAACAAQYSDHPAFQEYQRVNNIPGYRIGAPYFMRARSMVAGLFDRPTMDSVLGLGLLGMVAIRMGEPSATAFVAMAIRMAVEIKLDTDPDVEEVHGSLTWMEKEARRRLWWSLCNLDVTDCMASDRARIIADCDQPLFDRTPFFHDRSGRVKAPAPEVLWNSLESYESLPAMGLFVPGRNLDCADSAGRLSRVYSRIQQQGGAVSNIVQKASESGRPRIAEHSNTTAGNASRHIAAFAPETGLPPVYVSADLRSEVLHIEAELEAWKNALPAWAQDISHCTAFSPDSTSENPVPFQLLSLHIMYHSCYIALHLPALLRNPHNSSSTYLSTLAHTRVVTSLFERGMAADPDGQYIPLTNCFFIFYPAVVVALALSDETCHREEHLEWRRAFYLYLKWMRVLGVKWFLGEYLVKVLEGIVDEWGVAENDHEQ
ncbi:hypothetical protein PhCBS80983_g00409 [Powellomyces hirtus]|uniref:Zn(2)-C6 fungal-type domain-containing protein n=1 Tax=Powellomyces hirtus TaxID=109895 RepID=A0A507EFR2_9FUNG|nr:hypothetical protein PhCBS80983_g00409 [Powellomyces hirtus]